MGCLEMDGDVQLQYLIEHTCNNSQNQKIIMDTQFSLNDIPQETSLQITITPILPLLGLVGPHMPSPVKICKCSFGKLLQ